jgi:GalNAc-alpha-(1->4)-GalNAc-alpha-(1->3)-diNAcBac-PP-undecaprenol alpha-1,4-N-acetyl-D-galactosaminyltransferase
MRILLLTSSMTSGGAERVASTLANSWSSRGDQVTLMPTFSGRGECFYEISADVRLVYLADLVSSRMRTLLNQLSRLRELRRFMAAERPDVIVSFLSNVNVAAVLASAGLGIPVIVCERIDPFVMPKTLFLRLACRITYPLADALMVQTNAVASKYASSGLTLRRVKVIPNPVPRQIMNIQHHAGIGDKKRLLSVGRLDEQKQIDVLIKVFASLSTSLANWSLRIVGEGPLRPLLQSQIIKLGLEGRIELSGRTTNINDEFSEADAFVLTSKYEGFPNALLEAMAAGLPCVTFDCPSGPRELSLDGSVALLVPHGDEGALRCALEHLMLDENLRIKLGREAQLSVLERFSLDKVLVQWDSLFEEVGVLSLSKFKAEFH